jgi:phosphopantetheine--protein transferase-like protein
MSSVGIKHIGFDIVEVARFKKLGKNSPFFKKVFTERERIYCFSYKNPFPHFAGIFAVKEAVGKALGVNKFPLTAIEVRHAPSGKPELWLRGKRTKVVAVSISHTDTVAGAVVIV